MTLKSQEELFRKAIKWYRDDNNSKTFLKFEPCIILKKLIEKDIDGTIVANNVIKCIFVSNFHGEEDVTEILKHTKHFNYDVVVNYLLKEGWARDTVYKYVTIAIRHFYD